MLLVLGRVRAPRLYLCSTNPRIVTTLTDTAGGKFEPDP